MACSIVITPMGNFGRTPSRMLVLMSGMFGGVSIVLLAIT